MKSLTKYLASGALALALSAGVASAATLKIGGVGLLAGSIPGGAANSNEALIPLGLGAAGSLTGYYGSTISLSSTRSLKFTFLGSEACNTNTFTAPGGNFTTAGCGTFFNPSGYASFVMSNVAAGALSFSFKTNTLALPVVNGANPDNTGGGINFFASFGDNLANANTVGSKLYLFFDDSGANDDDNHDDMVVMVSEVPLPAAGFLLIGALGGLAFWRRRKTV